MRATRPVPYAVIATAIVALAGVVGVAVSVPWWMTLINLVLLGGCVGLTVYIWKRERRARQRRFQRIFAPKSPFDADKIGPGDQGYDFLMQAMRSGGAVHGVYDTRTGEIVSAKIIDKE